ncbi:MAG TPA: hypothetical protein VFE27_12095, partial [Acidobacteriaceae bacterium]|nr:hypothetical protein [Acidobacteriaceae bacterium]
FFDAENSFKPRLCVLIARVEPEDVIEVWRLLDAAPVCRRRRMKLAVKSCAYDLVGALEHLEHGWTLLSVSVRPPGSSD